MFDTEIPRVTDISVVRLDNNHQLDLTFFCKQGASSAILGGSFALGHYLSYWAVNPTPVAVTVLLHYAAPEKDILWLEIRLNGDNYSMLLNTRSAGVIHAGLQADPNKRLDGNIFSLRYRIRPQLLFLWKGRDDCFPKPCLLCAIYPQGDALTPDQESLITGPQMPSFRPLFASHRPAWSWAPLQYISSIVVQEQDDDPGFVGMCIYYEGGGRRFIGDAARFRGRECLRDSRAFAPITHMYVEKWVEPGRTGQFMKMRVHFGRGWRQGIDTEYEEYKLEGELHFWYGPLITPEFKVLPSGSWQQ
ncbi:hypothetical protein FPCIR_8068 [Fusarium pseudocircinatum]|uniref:Uncharacterized protein n=1 Tax=Fusarium pseudocircinatum TaxID=56676 RepID=A0A8H5L6X1_9HYPO|nr:hypothetical protein FPCIR_8068 [Fusarium pseudocircinatum]